MSNMSGGDRKRTKNNQNLQKAFKKSNNMNAGKGCAFILVIAGSVFAGAIGAATYAIIQVLS